MDNTDGSSSAAQSALLTENTDFTPQADAQDAPKGFWDRLWSRIGPAPTNDDGNDSISAVRNARPGMMNLRNMRVEDVMVPKADIISVPLGINRDDLVGVFSSSGLTRLPVYADTLDSPKGFVHLKDFALQGGFGGNGDHLVLADMLRPLLFVPPSMPIGVLLAKMQAERRHMALVIDEYGGVDGLVTIEDLIEQVIGEIEDEHDTEEDILFTQEKPGQYVALAKTPLDEFQAELDLDLTQVDDVDEEEVDSLGGLVFMLAGRVPARGEVVAHPLGVEFEVLDADPRRIKRLRVRLPNGAQPA